MPHDPTGPVSPPIRILIADDHPVVRDGLRGMFTGEPDFEVVGDAANGREATVKTHLLHTYAKLGVNDRAAAVAAAYNRGLLTPDDNAH